MKYCIRYVVTQELRAIFQAPVLKNDSPGHSASLTALIGAKKQVPNLFKKCLTEHEVAAGLTKGKKMTIDMRYFG